MNRSRIALVLAATLAAVASPAAAKEYQVKMLNKGADGVMVFEPAYVKAAVGDTVKFIAVDKGHDVESLAGLIPAGATPFKGAMNEEVVVKLTKPGVYAYKCTPHVGLGMVGVIQAGAATNKAEVTAAAAKLPGLAKMRMAKYLTQVK